MKAKFIRYLINSKYSVSRALNFPVVTPAFIQINVTSRCNLKCRICTTYQFPSSAQSELSTGEIRNIILQAKQMRINKIVFSGGEPLLREDIFKLFTFAKNDAQMELILTTNATLIDKAVTRKILDAGVNTVQISLDGADAKTHDHIRGSGAFAKTQEAINALNTFRSEGLAIGLSYTVNSYNYHQMHALLELGQNLGVDHVLFIPFIEDNTYAHSNHSLSSFLLNREKIDDFRGVIRKIVDFKNRHAKPAIINAHNLYLYEKYFNGTLKNRHWQCFAGFHWIQINPNGDLTMCGFHYGNIRENRLKDIWYSAEAFRARGRIKQCQKLCLQPCMSKP
ncbi:MAG: radical SAM protein [Candidatus Omnitrophica bacterium]|nr:radical SAM protein [Candidatus Omnitrophota bacterium]